MRCTGPYHLSMYVCVYCAVGLHPHRWVDWLALVPRAWGCVGYVPPARAPPLHCSSDNARVCALGAGALPHMLQQRCLCVNCIYTYIDYVRSMYGVPGTHTPAWPTPPPRSGRPCGRCGGAVCYITPTMQLGSNHLNCVEAYQSWVCNDAF
jgi:hypothetical protein